jgi:tRNA G18 (ribose-2'-O)-methylase SpoU
MLSFGDNRFGPVVTAAKSLKEREKKQIFLIEGRRLVLEAVQTAQKFKSIFFTDFEILHGLPLEDNMLFQSGSDEVYRFCG